MTSNGLVPDSNVTRAMRRLASMEHTCAQELSVISPMAHNTAFIGLHQEPAFIPARRHAGTELYRSNRGAWLKLTFIATQHHCADCFWALVQQDRPTEKCDRLSAAGLRLCRLMLTVH